MRFNKKRLEVELFRNLLDPNQQNGLSHTTKTDKD